MNNPNTGWLYYRNYYQDINFAAKKDDTGNERLFKQKNELIFKQKTGEQQFSYPSFLQHFQLETTYPGLLLGSGYTHGTGLLGELKIGFFFDHTTGMPIIPGSSIKGTLRNAFPGLFLKKANDTQLKESEKKHFEKLAAARYEYLIDLLGERLELKAFLSLPDQEAKEIFIDKLEHFCFDGQVAKEKEGKIVWEEEPMSARDIFHDAIIVKSKHPARTDHGTPENCIFSDDYITPHKNNSGDGIPDYMKNPTPISFLKVLPEVTFKFQFDLKETQAGLTAKERQSVFKIILLDFGVGAKTNVGYGHLRDPNNTTEETNESLDVFEEEKKAVVAEHMKTPIVWGKDYDIDAVVIEHPHKKYAELYLPDGKTEKMEITGKSSNVPAPGTIIRVNIQTAKKNNKKRKPNRISQVDFLNSK